MEGAEAEKKAEGPPDRSRKEDRNGQPVTYADVVVGTGAQKVEEEVNFEFSTEYTRRLPWTLKQDWFLMADIALFMMRILSNFRADSW